MHDRNRCSVSFCRAFFLTIFMKKLLAPWIIWPDEQAGIAWEHPALDKEIMVIHLFLERRTDEKT